MKKNKNWKRVIILLLGLLVFALILVVACFSAKIRREYPDISVNSQDRIVYDDAEELETAFSNYADEENEEKAEIVTGYQASQHKVALVFCGMTTPTEMTKVLDLLDSYNAKATFVCDGMAAAEDPDTVAEIMNRGNTLGNYGMNGETHWEESEDETILTSLARTQAVFKRIT